MTLKIAYISSGIGSVLASVGFIFSATNLLRSRHNQELVSALEPLPQDGAASKSIYAATSSLAQTLGAQALVQTCLWALAFVLFGAAAIATHRSNQAFKRTGYARRLT